MPPITDIQESKRIPADSEVLVTLGGFWSGTLQTGAQATGNVVADNTGAAVAQGSHTAFVSLYRKSDGVQVVNRQPMTTWLPTPGCFSTILAATAVPSGSFPFRRIIEIFGSGGTSDTLHATLKADYVESDGAR